MGLNRALLIGYLGVVWSFNTAATVGDPVASKSAQALGYFERGEYAEALQLYRDAQLERPEMSELNFNVGGTLFKNGDYETALREFEQAAGVGSDPLKAAAQYNMGNVFYQQEQYEQAVQAYRQALELNFADLDAKANLELALRQIEEQQKQEEQDKEQEQQNQEQQDEEQQEQQENSGEQDQQDQEKQEQEQQDQQDREQQEQENSGEQEQDPQDAAGQEPQKISPEEAEQLLDALKDREVDAQKRRYRATGKTRGKDW
ncbi:MAG: tetratricopeptide repeat protein [Candidatus Latescibacterota bacterium]|jgi:Ca-activated chloride channel family protein